MGTHSVTILEQLARAHDQAGQVLVAAPVLGRPEAAAAGQLGIVPAGPRRRDREARAAVFDPSAGARSTAARIPPAPPR
jgi:3-hydroxyisobutyrate dehydrogenase-like beta-hydroxyacid dehydrogenase